MKRSAILIPGCTAMLLWAAAVHGQEPALPAGLGGGDEATVKDEPSLPAGMGSPDTEKEPDLPAGLHQQDEKKAAPPSPDSGRKNVFLPVDLTGFIDLRAGLRTRTDPHEPEYSLGEIRLQTEGEKAWGNTVLHGRIDFVYDTVVLNRDIRLNEGRGWLDLRELSLLLRPLSNADMEIGRQILTWGVGDLLFINDLFPKDWNSFFLGRAVEYLKAPSDALKASFYTDLINFNVVYTPQFDPDRYIDGTVVSYYNSRLQETVGRNAPVLADIPDTWFDDDELAVRAYRRINSFETALYLYRGFWKSPAGFDAERGRAAFPALNVYGTSIRGPLLGGIGRWEGGWYDSREDRSGGDPNVRNSEARVLLGYERELARNFTGAVQYYLEYMLDHDEYLATLPDHAAPRDQDRHVMTLRLTRLLLNQNLELSFFAFYSPSDEDAYLRPLVGYKIDDHWSAGCGGNFFLGREEHTFFGQFENNSNIYFFVRYSY
jgi:hypothetical protein